LNTFKRKLKARLSENSEHDPPPEHVSGAENEVERDENRMSGPERGADGGAKSTYGS